MRSSIPIRNTSLVAAGKLIDGATGNGLLKGYTGSAPTTFGTTPGGTLLFTLTMARPCVATTASGVATFAALTSDTSADATGTMGCFVIQDSSGNICYDGTITAIGGGGDLEASTTTVNAGETVSASSLGLKIPQS